MEQLKVEMWTHALHIRLAGRHRDIFQASTHICSAPLREDPYTALLGFGLVLINGLQREFSQSLAVHHKVILDHPLTVAKRMPGTTMQLVYASTTLTLS